MSDSPGSRTDTRAKIIDVAARLLQEQGPAAVTTRGVAETAGLQAPTIYRLFGDKEGMLDAVAEHVRATYVSTKTAIVKAAEEQHTDPLDDLRTGWQMQIDFGVANPTLFALLTDPSRARRSPAALSGERVLRSRIHRIAMTGRLRVSEPRAVALIHSAGTGTILTILSTPPAQRDPGLADAMYDAVIRQIVTDAPEGAASGFVAPTVAFRAIAPQLPMFTDAEHRLLAEWLDRAIKAL